jgi:hypothetical protein
MYYFENCIVYLNFWKYLPFKELSADIICMFVLAVFAKGLLLNSIFAINLILRSQWESIQVLLTSLT